MNINLNQPMVCLCCLEPGAYLGFDKHGRPFVRCATGCGTMTFLRTKSALRGIVWLSEIANQTRAQIATDPEFRAKREKEFLEFDRALANRYIELSKTHQPFAPPAAQPEIQVQKVG